MPDGFQLWTQVDERCRLPVSVISFRAAGGLLNDPTAQLPNFQAMIDQAVYGVDAPVDNLSYLP
jgi:hypothetical protein